MMNGLRVTGRVRIPAQAMSAAHALVVVMCCLLQAGCAGLLDTQRPAETRYWLEPVGVTRSAVGATREVELQLTVVPGLDTDRVLALEAEARLAQLEHARWADHLPEVLHSVLGRSLRSNGLIPAEHAADCKLDLEVQAFFLVRGAGAAGSASVALEGRLDCMGRAQNVSAKASVPPRGESVAQAVAALQQALDEVTRDLLGEVGEFMSAS